VLMTATFAEKTFVPFFQGLLGKPEILQVSGRCYPVKEWYIEDALAWTGATLGDMRRRATVSDKMIDEVRSRLMEAHGGIERNFGKDVYVSLNLNREKDVDQDKQRMLAALCSLIDAAAVENGDESRGAILVFLPGWRDIMNMGIALRDMEENEIADEGKPEGTRKYHIVPLHGQLSPEEQHLVFDPSPPNKRKIILSTDIAETSVTIDDVVYVINAGITKDKVFDVNLNTGILESSLNTKTNATQRKGRAGRTREGVCIHLFPRYSVLKEFPEPAILSTSLEEIVLQQLCLDLGHGPHDFLSKTLSVPPFKRVDSAVKTLQNIGALLWEEELVTLTPLGSWLGQIPQHPQVSLMMTYGGLFGCLLPVTVLSAFLGAKWPFSIIDRPSDGYGKVGLGKPTNSDHAAVVTAFLDYKEILAKGFDPDQKAAAVAEAENYLEMHKLSKEQMDMADQHVKSFLMFMAQHGYHMPDVSYKGLCLGSWTKDVCLDNTRLVLFKAALCGGYQPNFALIKKGGKFHISNDEEVVINNGSCNKGYRPSNEGTEFAMWTDMMAFNKVSMNDTTIVGAAYVVLLCQKFELYPDHPGWFRIDEWEAHLPNETLEDIIELRKVLAKMMTWMVDSQTFTPPRSVDLDPMIEFLKTPLTLNSIRGVGEKKQSERDNRTLFVKGFGNASQFELVQFFMMNGLAATEVTVPQDYHSGKSKDFGFVEMADREQAMDAVEKLHNAPMGSRTLHVELKVSFAEEEKPNQDT